MCMRAAFQSCWVIALPSAPLPVSKLLITQQTSLAFQWRCKAV